MHIGSTVFKNNTLFVLGAGASCEAGLPLGFELAETLAQDLNIQIQNGRLAAGDESVAAELSKVSQRAGRNQSELIRVARTVAAGVRDAESIDNFVEIHFDKPDVQRVAKIAISIAIARAEKKANLFVHDAQSRRWFVREGYDAGRIKPRDTWYQKFFEIAKDGVRSDDLGNLFKEVRVVCFNYDRTLELFLSRKIEVLYSVSHAEAAKAVQNLNIIRPYGGLGPLPGLEEEDPLDFGELNYEVNFDKISENIRTYSELPGSEVNQKISDSMNWARHIVFLGFGFHKQNMKILSRDSDEKINVYATAKGMSQPNKIAIKQRIHETFRGAFALPSPWSVEENPVLEDASCGELLSRYREVLRN